MARARKPIDALIGPDARWNRRVVAELGPLFRAGRAPDPAPAGFAHSRFLTLAEVPTLDAALQRLFAVWMPWLGKRFNPAAGTGVNVLAARARLPMKVLWPAYRPVRRPGGRLEAFPFRTSVAESLTDPGVEVLRIDYDIAANPRRIVRRVLDELVQVDDHRYLGRILYRRQGSFRPIGWFALER